MQGQQDALQELMKKQANMNAMTSALKPGDEVTAPHLIVTPSSPRRRVLERFYQSFLSSVSIID